jgi:hypothetical protein
MPPNLETRLPCSHQLPSEAPHLDRLGAALGRDISVPGPSGLCAGTAMRLRRSTTQSPGTTPLRCTRIETVPLQNYARPKIQKRCILMIDFSQDIER